MVKQGEDEAGKGVFWARKVTEKTRDRPDLQNKKLSKKRMNSREHSHDTLETLDAPNWRTFSQHAWPSTENAGVTGTRDRHVG